MGIKEEEGEKGGPSLLTIAQEELRGEIGSAAVLIEEQIKKFPAEVLPLLSRLFNRPSDFHFPARQLTTREIEPALINAWNSSAWTPRNSKQLGQFNVLIPTDTDEQKILQEGPQKTLLELFQHCSEFIEQLDNAIPQKGVDILGKYFEKLAREKN